MSKDIKPTAEVKEIKKTNSLERKRYNQYELKEIANEKYFANSKLTEIYASEFGQFFYSERALIEATKDYPNILKIKISR